MIQNKDGSYITLMAQQVWDGRFSGPERPSGYRLILHIDGTGDIDGDYFLQNDDERLLTKEEAQKKIESFSKHFRKT